MSKFVNAVSNFSTQRVLGVFVKWAAIIVFVLSAAILAYLSFVSDLRLNPNVKNLTTIALIALVLNYMVWDMFFKDGYNKVLSDDLTNKQYCIHKRYYDARKNLKYDDVQAKISIYNKKFIEAWITDIEDITGRTRQEIISQPYKGNSSKWLIYKLKHKIYPKSGIRTPRDLLQVLQVGNSGTIKIDLSKPKRDLRIGRINKIITSAVGTFLAASLAYEFIDGDMKSTLLKVVFNIVLLCMSLFGGSISGTKSSQAKLSITEEVSELLEEWKNEPPSQEPYSDLPNVNSKIVNENDIKENKNTIELT